MKKAIIILVVLFVIAALTAFVSFCICGGELISTGIRYGVESYREYKMQNPTQALIITNNMY